MTSKTRRSLFALAYIDLRSGSVWIRYGAGPGERFLALLEMTIQLDPSSRTK